MTIGIAGLERLERKRVGESTAIWRTPWGNIRAFDFTPQQRGYRRRLFCLSTMDGDAAASMHIQRNPLHGKARISSRLNGDFIKYLLNSSSSKRIPSIDRAKVSVITTELNHYIVFLMEFSNKMISRGKQETLVRRSTKPNINGFAKVSLSILRRRLCICIPSRDWKISV